MDLTGRMPSPERRPRRFTVDDLFTLPDWGMRAEVLDGRLLLAPPQSRRHERTTGNLAARFRLVLPGGAAVRTHQPVRLPDGDGPVPDLLVGPAGDWPRGTPAGQVHTVGEVVSADGRHLDRVWKRQRYEDAGVPCYWRVELAPWPGYRGPLPVVVIRLRERTGWRDIVAAAGWLHTLPVAYGRDRDGAAVTVPVRVDPATLAVRQAMTW
jgi:Uma2 family endonuclease